ncbi:hypothetical protein RAD15_03875 [Bradyrhizobium sp. 14AA]
MSRTSLGADGRGHAGKMIDARIEESRRENKGRVHRLNCGAFKAGTVLKGTAKRNVDPARLNGGDRSKIRTGQDHAD